MGAKRLILSAAVALTTSALWLSSARADDTTTTSTTSATSTTSTTSTDATAGELTTTTSPRPADLEVRWTLPTSMRFSDGVQADEAWIITNIGGLPARDVVVRLEWGGDYTEGDVALLDDAGAAGPPCTEGGLDVCAPFTLQPGQSRIAVGRLASTPFDPALPYTLTLGLVASSPDDPDAVNNGNVTISDYWGPLPPIDASTTMQFHPEAVRLPETGTTSSAALWWAVFVVLAGAGLASVARRRGESPN